MMQDERVLKGTDVSVKVRHRRTVYSHCLTEISLSANRLELNGEGPSLSEAS